MAIKNWTITAESTKSAAAREKYMNNMEHPNHKNTEAIFTVFGSAASTLNIIKNCEERKLINLLKGKGGRPPTEAMEFVFTLPKGIRPNKEEWQKMLRGVMSDVAKKIDKSFEDFLGITRGVVHQQNQSADVKGTGDHVHLMIGKFTNDGCYMPELQQKGVLHVMKTSFNKQVRDVMGVDNNSYEPSKEYLGVAKKRVPRYVAKTAEAKKELEQREKAVSRMELSLEMTQANFAKNLASLATHVEKYNQALLDNDDKQQNRQLNRMNKPLEMAKEIQATEGFESTPELEQATESLNKQLDKINVALDADSRKPLLDMPRKK
jgi:hypothetical protein